MSPQHERNPLDGTPALYDLARHTLRDSREALASRARITTRLPPAPHDDSPSP
ncbi:hypothetical protein [Streptodolium elevatio]|uniref:Uncharacterized protein n=1 Tax=Streptodolium elevatio TaxID=3157996 RepID=A0ABV3DM42_9ACTN